MLNNPQFVRAWYNWLRLRRPTESYAVGRRGAPGYDTECEIDHIYSWVYSIGSDHLGGHGRDYVHGTDSLLDDIGELRERIRGEELAPELRARYEGYLQSTADLLIALRACHDP